MGKDKRANREAEVRSDRDGDTENEERKKDTADADEVKKNVQTRVEKQMPLRNGWNCIWINIRIVEIKRR